MYKRQGDELVAETTLFKGVMVLNQSGLTLSEDVVMSERWKQTGPDTLTDTITPTDAKALKVPFTFVKTCPAAPRGRQARWCAPTCGYLGSARKR